MISIICGFLWKQGYINGIIAGCVIICGNLMGDILLYYLGYYKGKRLLKRFEKFFNVSDTSLERIEKLYQKHGLKILFLSKITNGLGMGILILIGAGVSKVKFIKYMVINFLGEIIWTFSLVTIGYYFGQFYNEINGAMSKFFFTFFGIILVIIFFRFIRKIQIKNI